MSWDRQPRRAVLLLGALLACAQLTTTAHADPVCTYDASMHQVNAIVDPPNGTTYIEGDDTVAGTPIVLYSGPFRAVCGDATMANTDRISVLGAGGVVVFYARSVPFGPNIALSADGFDMVSYAAPADVPATITAGTVGVNLDSDKAVDLTYGGATTLSIEGSDGGGDVVSAQGGRTTGGKLPRTVSFDYGQSSGAVGSGRVTVKGHDGPDNLVAAACTGSELWGFDGADHLVGCNGGPSVLHGGKGDDDLSVDSTGSAVYGDAGNDTLVAFDQLVETVDGGKGNDLGYVDSDDVVANVERIP
jgi:hypothetical protein